MSRRDRRAGRFERDPEGLSREELEEQAPEPLPARESMSLMGGDVSIPLDPAAAADALVDSEEPEGDPGPAPES
jgi:hypothetical protein